MRESNKFGNLVKNLREEINISQKKLADKMDITPTYMSKIERGEFPPPAEKVIKKMAGIFGVDSDKLLATADKVDSELLEIIKQNPVHYGAILRNRKK